MKLAHIKTKAPFDVYNFQRAKIITYGERNDFPQALEEVVMASKTASSCLDVYLDFILGHGFANEDVADMMVNEKETANKLLKKIAKDRARYNGVVLHFNYNILGKITSIHCCPFEDYRLEKPDEDTGRVTCVKYHPDWGRRDRYRLTWKPSLIETFPVYNPDPEVVIAQINGCGGIDNYKGQILYYSFYHDCPNVYPVPKYVAEVTDMRSEEGLANVTGKNVCSNFTVAGMVVDITDEDVDERQLADKQQKLNAFQGDENSLALWYVQAKNENEVPKFVPVQMNNYDKAYSQTQSVIPMNIGEVFKQPPVLRARDVGSNFGADLMRQAYDFYNSVTARERAEISDLLYEVLENWFAPLDDIDLTIQPLSYNAGSTMYEKIGKDAFNKIMEIVGDKNLTLTQKRNSIKFGFQLPDSEVTKLLPNTSQEGGIDTSLIEALGVGGMQVIADMMANGSPKEAIQVYLEEIVRLPETSAERLASATLNPLDAENTNDQN